MKAVQRYAAVLFDLDGTLIDSAPDLAGAANDMRTHRGLPAADYASLRPMVGSGARGMFGAAFGITPAHDEFAAMKDEFLRRYEAAHDPADPASSPPSGRCSTNSTIAASAGASSPTRPSGLQCRWWRRCN